MSLILNIDTALHNASVSIAKNGDILSQRLNKSQVEHAGWLHQAIKEVLEESKKNISDLNGISVVAGPGSYTGLRIGMAAAKGLCYSANLPLITINTLEIMTFSIIKNYNISNNFIDPPALFCPMLDARRMEVFTALYNIDIEEIMKPCALILEEDSFAKYLQKNQIIFFGNGSSKLSTLNIKKNVFHDDYNYTSKDVALYSHIKNVPFHFANLAYSEPFYLKEFYIHPK